MSEINITDITARVLNGTATMLDHKELKHWRSLSEENELLYISIKKYWDHKIPREKTESENIRTENLLNYAKTSLINTPKSVKVISIKRILFYAAGIALILSFGFVAGTILSNKTSVNKTSEIFVSRGSRANITLPDGTIVWLGHDSHLSYKEKFNGKNRQVSLSGEAFFDVASDDGHPFFVYTSGPTIKVTGTEFYIQAYPSNPSVETSLISGKIDLMLNNRLLSKMQPHTNLVYIKQTGTLLSGKYDDNFLEFWKKGEYSFVDKPFSELAIMMKRIYNVEIIFKDKALKDKRFTGSLGVDDNIYTLLEIFKKSSSTSFNYSIENNNKILVMSGK
jgi:ferric-dicitrate binding protein FerR (iron transport regulator)